MGLCLYFIRPLSSWQVARIQSIYVKTKVVVESVSGVIARTMHGNSF